jgi:hypothetical protein
VCEFVVGHGPDGLRAQFAAHTVSMGHGRLMVFVVGLA